MMRILIAIMLACVVQAYAQTTSGTLSGNETWSDTVTVTGDIILEGSLMIEPGTLVKFSTSNDNIVLGSSSRIRLIVMATGSLIAEGTKDERITFTTTSSFPAKGNWGMIQIIANGQKSRLSYCDFEYMANGICIEKPAGVTGTSDFRMVCCNFEYGSGTAIFVSDGDSVMMSGCSILRCGKGVFAGGAAYAGLYNSSISSCANGIIGLGETDWNSRIEIDHCIVYNIDKMLAGTAPNWWSGYAIYLGNDCRTMVLTNTVVYVYTLYAMQPGCWTVIRNNNCMNPGFLGLGILEDCVLHISSTGQSPLFVEPGYGDFQFDPDSPCINASDDGTDIGLIYGSEGEWQCRDGAACIRRFIVPNTVLPGAMFDMNGNAVTGRFEKYGVYLYAGTDGVLCKRMILE